MDKYRDTSELLNDFVYNTRYDNANMPPIPPYQMKPAIDVNTALLAKIPGFVRIVTQNMHCRQDPGIRGDIAFAGVTTGVVGLGYATNPIVGGIATLASTYVGPKIADYFKIGNNTCTADKNFKDSQEGRAEAFANYIIGDKLNADVIAIQELQYDPAHARFLEIIQTQTKWRIIFPENQICKKIGFCVRTGQAFVWNSERVTFQTSTWMPFRTEYAAGFDANVSTKTSFKGILCGTFILNDASKAKFSVFNIHPSPYILNVGANDYRNDHITIAHIAQVLETMQEIKKITPSTQSVIICGDFNINKYIHNGLNYSSLDEIRDSVGSYIPTITARRDPATGKSVSANKLFAEYVKSERSSADPEYANRDLYVYVYLDTAAIGRFKAGLAATFLHDEDLKKSDRYETIKLVENNKNANMGVKSLLKIRKDQYVIVPKFSRALKNRHIYGNTIELIDDVNINRAGKCFRDDIPYLDTSCTIDNKDIIGSEFKTIMQILHAVAPVHLHSSKEDEPPFNGKYSWESLYNSVMYSPLWSDNAFQLLDHIVYSQCHKIPLYAHTMVKRYKIEPVLVDEGPLSKKCRKDKKEIKMKPWLFELYGDQTNGEYYYHDVADHYAVECCMILPTKNESILPIKKQLEFILKFVKKQKFNIFHNNDDTKSFPNKWFKRPKDDPTDIEALLSEYLTDQIVCDVNVIKLSDKNILNHFNRFILYDIANQQLIEPAYNKPFRPLKKIYANREGIIYDSTNKTRKLKRIDTISQESDIDTSAALVSPQTLPQRALKSSPRRFQHSIPTQEQLQRQFRQEQQRFAGLPDDTQQQVQQPVMQPQQQVQQQERYTQVVHPRLKELEGMDYRRQLLNLHKELIDGGFIPKRKNARKTREAIMNRILKGELKRYSLLRSERA
jgi:hypothetical protein